jgi:hypothetical protein
VTVYSEDGHGKIVPSISDGIAFYYTKLDSVNDNFVLEADVHVDKWTLSTGQEGFGLVVTDRVGQNGDCSDIFWNNSYMAAATHIEYRWDMEKGEITTNPEIANSTKLKIGIGSIARTGVPEGYTGSLAPTGFDYKTDTLETRTGELYGSGTYNIIGNCTNEIVENKDDITDLHFKIQRDNTGYKISYTDTETGKTTTNIYYDEKCFDENCENHNGVHDNGTLMQMDRDSVYAGFFAARNARATFSNIKLTITDATTDSEPEKTVKQLIDNSFRVVSASNASSEDYKLEFYGNAPGKLTVTTEDGTVVADNDEIGMEEKISYNVKLNKGINKFNWIMEPTPDYELADNTFLKDYSEKTGTFEVTYNTIEGKYIYVAPNGTADGDGSNEKPLDIYSAIEYISAGQTIVLMEGTYELTDSLRISRCISGTADKPITMMAAPDAKTRPVIDFMQTSNAGMKIAGDYWYLQGFDVTGSGDKMVGIQVSGNYNTLDNIMTYKNGDTGIKISRLNESDTSERDENGEYKYWPSYNTILNCTSYANSNASYSADGFQAKNTVGNGNLFDGCIAAYNADEGWDLYASSDIGTIGRVIIKNCIAYGNGYRYGVTDDSGELLEAGNGNGFKMGGNSISAYHSLINSVAFNNRGNGIDSATGPDVQVENCISFDNGRCNVALYTSNAENTDYKAHGIISYRKNSSYISDYFYTTGSQEECEYKNETTYYFLDGVSENTVGEQVTDDWFVSLTGPKLNEFELVGRNKTTNKIDLGDFLKLTDKAAEGVGARNLDTTGESSKVIEIVNDDKIDTEPGTDESESKPSEPGTDESESKPSEPGTDESESKPSEPGTDESESKPSEPGTDESESKPSDPGTEEPSTEEPSTEEPEIEPSTEEPEAKEGFSAVLEDNVYSYSYTGSAITPAVKATNNGLTLTEGTDYTVKYSNNTNAGTATVTVTGKGSYSGSEPINFEIRKQDIGDKENVKATDKVVAVSGKKPKITVIFNGMTLGSKDYRIEYSDGTATLIAADNGNFKGTRTITIETATKDQMKKLAAELTDPKYSTPYTGAPIVLASDRYKVTTAGTQERLNESSDGMNGDYIITYSNNTNAGTAKITFTGIGYYTGSTVTKTFKIIPATTGINNETSVNGKKYSYNTAGVTIGADLKFTYGSGKVQLVENKDYKVKYTNNKKPGTAGYTVTFAGNFKGYAPISGKFTIDTPVIDNTTVAAVSADRIYRKKGVYASAPIVTINGTTVKSSEYTVNYYLNEEMTEEMTKAAPLEFSKNEAYVTIYAKITSKGKTYAPADGRTYATCTYKVWNPTAVTDLSKAKITVNGATKNKVPYTGKELKPEITVEVKNGKTYEKIDSDKYEVIYINNINLGKATIVVKARENSGYAGSKTAAFTIVKKDVKNN